MKRIVFLMICCLVLTSGMISGQASAEEPAWVSAYEQILDSRRLQITEEPVEYSTPELWYLVYDIDKDGTPELIVKTGACEADCHGGIFTFRNGRAFRIGEYCTIG